MKKIFYLFTFLFFLFLKPVFAVTLLLPNPANDVVGDLQMGFVEPGDTISSLAQRYDVGYYAILEANPGLNEDELYNWEQVVIPTRYILPPGPRKGMVINLAELRIYYYPPNSNEVIILPIGVGRKGWETPVGHFYIERKKLNPTWYVPKSIREFRAKQGVELPVLVPPGPENPLGKHAFYLSIPTYLIHGTNDPSGVGMRSSAGCIRLYPEDIASIFDAVEVGTRVRVINQSVKAGWFQNEFYIESHVPLDRVEADPRVLDQRVNQAVSQALVGRSTEIDLQKARELAGQQHGIPEMVNPLAGYNDYSQGERRWDWTSIQHEGNYHEPYAR